MKLWHYESGRNLQSIDLRQHGFLNSSDTDTEKVNNTFPNDSAVAKGDQLEHYQLYMALGPQLEYEFCVLILSHDHLISYFSRILHMYKIIFIE